MKWQKICLLWWSGWVVILVIVEFKLLELWTKE